MGGWGVTGAGCAVVHSSRRPFLPCSVREPRLAQLFPSRGHLGVETARGLHDLRSSSSSSSNSSGGDSVRLDRVRVGFG